MEGIITLRDIIKEVESSTFIDMSQFGRLREDLSNDTKIYDPYNTLLTTLVAYYSYNRLVRISFAGAALKIKLADLVESFGQYHSAYNFRDNFTQFVFSLSGKSTRIKELSVKRENNIYPEGDDSFLEKDQRGHILQLKNADILFNNFFIYLL